MNVLIIGGMSSLTNQLIRKIKREGHRVYLLTGKRYSATIYEKVFERYDLTYDSECLGDVFESVNPDVTLFMGAFDSNFRWFNEERELVRITSSLTNLLTAHAMTCKGRFIHLSSDAVYSENYEADVEEDTPTSPNGLKGMALAQCEDICASFRKNRGADIVVLRVDHFYMIPETPDDMNDICSCMCLEALKTGNISVDRGKRFSLLYESDVVEFIFQLICCREHQHPVYNLSVSREQTETEIAQYIQQAMGGAIAGIAIEEKEGRDHRCILANQRFSDEFSVKIFADTQESVEKVAQYMTVNKNLFLRGEQKTKNLWKRFVKKTGWLVSLVIPCLENLACFFLIFLLNSSEVVSKYFHGMDFYLLYVLLFAVVHGQRQAIVSSVLAVAGFYFTQRNGRTFPEAVLDNGAYLWIAQLFIVGLTAGYIKDQIHKLKMEREEERQFLSQQLADIKEINSSNVRIKDALAAELVNQCDSIGKVYQITSKLNQYKFVDVLFYATEILGELLESSDIAIYMVSDDTYARLFAFTSEQAKALGKFPRYRELGEVYDALTERKVYINKTMDRRYPMMANAIFEDDQIKIIIMVWGVPWERMTLGQADLLTAVSCLIQNAVLRATRQIALLENRRCQADGYVMEQEAFTLLVHAFLTARNKGLTECEVLQIVPQSVNESNIQTDRQTNTHGAFGPEGYGDAGKALACRIRKEDYIGTLKDGNLYILLSNSNITDAELVIKRIEGVGYRGIVLEDITL